MFKDATDSTQQVTMGGNNEVKNPVVTLNEKDYLILKKQETIDHPDAKVSNDGMVKDVDWVQFLPSDMLQIPDYIGKIYSTIRFKTKDLLGARQITDEIVKGLVINKVKSNGLGVNAGQNYLDIMTGYENICQFQNDVIVIDNGVFNIESCSYQDCSPYVLGDLTILTQVSVTDTKYKVNVKKLFSHDCINIRKTTFGDIFEWMEYDPYDCQRYAFFTNDSKLNLSASDSESDSDVKSVRFLNHFKDCGVFGHITPDSKIKMLSYKFKVCFPVVSELLIEVKKGKGTMKKDIIYDTKAFNLVKPVDRVQFVRFSLNNVNFYVHKNYLSNLGVELDTFEDNYHEFCDKSDVISFFKKCDIKVTLKQKEIETKEFQFGCYLNHKGSPLDFSLNKKVTGIDYLLNIVWTMMINQAMVSKITHKINIIENSYKKIKREDIVLKIGAMFEETFNNLDAFLDGIYSESWIQINQQLSLNVIVDNLNSYLTKFSKITSTKLDFKKMILV